MENRNEISGVKINLIWAALLLMVSISFFTYVFLTATSYTTLGVISFAALVFIPTIWIEKKILTGVFHSLNADLDGITIRKLQSTKFFQKKRIKDFSIYYEISDNRNIVTDGIVAIIGIFLFSAYMDTGKMKYYLATSETTVEDTINFVNENHLKQFVDYLTKIGYEISTSKLPRKNGLRRIVYTMKSEETMNLMNKEIF